MAARVMIDTDVLIDCLRGIPDAIAYFRGLEEQPLVSLITLAELYSGVREGTERRDLENLIEGVELVPLTLEAAVSAGLLRRDYKKSHSIGLSDALIAASAQAAGATLVTLNRKHFPMLSDLVVPYRKS